MAKLNLNKVCLSLQCIIIQYSRGRQPPARVPIMARDVVFYGTRSRENVPKTFLNDLIIKKISFRAKQVINLLCFVLLFSHQYFFISTITSLL